MAVGQRLGLPKLDNFGIIRVALLVVLVAWLPLAILALLQSLWTGTDETTSLLREVGVHARYIFAAPLLAVAGTVCASHLNVIAQHFTDGGIVDEVDHSALRHAIAATRQLLRSPVANVVTVALAYLVAVTAAVSYTPDQLPDWAKPTGGMFFLSLAGWWHTLVSLPLLLVLIFGWFWRLALWAQLLWRVSRFKLRLVASHPDHSAGLGILSQSLGAFAPIGMALAAIAAGRSAHVVIQGGALPTPHIYFNIGLVAVVLVLFVAPLLVFLPALLETWRRGVREYGELAEHVGTTFEKKWLTRHKDAPDVLEKPDFSATADLYSVVANVHAMRFVPVDFKDLTALAVATALPFAPVILLAFPLESIWSHIKSLLL